MELIIAIVVMSLALAGAISLYVVTVQSSADPMTRQQAQLVAEAYLEEMLLKRFYDPNTNTVCPAPEGSRSLYDNFCDYDGINETPPRDQYGSAIAALSAYTVQVSMARDNTVTLNGLTNGPAANEIRVLRADVTVTGPSNASVTLTGYRTNYNCNVSTDSACKGP